MGGPGGTEVEVRWEAPASCPDAETARAEIMTRIADRPAARELEATARVRALDDGGWQVDVELRTNAGTATRMLRAASCEEALTATAVVVAIAVDPSLVPPPVEGPTATVPLPPTDAVSPAVSPSLVERAEAGAATSTEVDVDRGEGPASANAEVVATRPALELAIAARGGVDFGALPSPAGHVAAAVGVLGPRWVVQAGALHRIRTETPAPLPRPAGGRFRLTAAQLLAGPRLQWGALVLPLAAGLELGAIWARGTGEVEPIAVRRPWVAALVSAGLGWAPREAFALHVGVDGVVPLLRPTFTLGNAVEVLTVGPFAVRAWMGVMGRFSVRESRRGGKEP